MTTTSNRLSDQELREKADQIRALILKMVHAANSGHPGGPLGLADIFSVLFFDVMKHNPSDPDWAERDRLLISNGHVSAVRYAAMALSGYFEEKEIFSFRKLGSALQGHPSTRYLKGVENSSGSLGQGLSQAVGLALAGRFRKEMGRVYVCTSDGEMGEGMSWEGAQAGAHYKAPVIAFMDMNGIQIDGKTKDVMDLRDLGLKFRAFGWHVIEADGHNISEIRSSFEKAGNVTDAPVMILFRTVLGKGVSFMEDQPGWHGKPPSDADLAKALGELGLN